MKITRKRKQYNKLTRKLISFSTEDMLIEQARLDSGSYLYEGAEDETRNNRRRMGACKTANMEKV